MLLCSVVDGGIILRWQRTPCIDPTLVDTVGIWLTDGNLWAVGAKDKSEEDGNYFLSNLAHHCQTLRLQIYATYDWKGTVVLDTSVTVRTVTTVCGRPGIRIPGHHSFQAHTAFLSPGLTKRKHAKLRDGKGYRQTKPTSVFIHASGTIIILD